MSHAPSAGLWDEALTLLESCVWQVVIPPATAGAGTAFAVSGSQLLTCRHVVNGLSRGAEIHLHAPKRTTLVGRLGSVYPSDEVQDPWPDLAIIDIDPIDPWDSVILHTRALAADETVYVGGYPAKTEVSYQTRKFTVNPHNRDRHGHQSIGISNENVMSGMSGAPVLTAEGFICGYVRLSRNTTQNVGGFVVPLSEVVPAVAELEPMFNDPGSTARAWLALPNSGLRMKAAGRDERGKRYIVETPDFRIIDLWLTGIEGVSTHHETTSWEVRIDGDAADPHRFATVDLGAGVLDALGFWSRRDLLRAEVQVRLLGRVLFRALMHTDLRELISRRDGELAPLVRLRTSADEPLSLIPWEYAADDQALATSPDWCFSRYTDVTKSPLPAEESIDVLFVVNCADPTDREEIVQFVGGRFAGDRSIRPTLCVGASWESVRSKLTDRSWHIVHFIGRCDDDGMLGFHSLGKLRSTDRSTINEHLSASSRAVVLQLDTVDGASRALAEALPLLESGTSVRAVVIDERARAAERVLQFIESFYARVAVGDSVETAVQVARRALRESPPRVSGHTDRRYDNGAFGAVSVITTRTGDVRLVSPETGGPGSRSENAGAGDPVHVSQDPPASPAAIRPASRDRSAFERHGERQ